MFSVLCFFGSSFLFNVSALQPPGGNQVDGLPPAVSERHVLDFFLPTMKILFDAAP